MISRAPIDQSIVTGLVAALFGILLSTFIFSYLYPVLYGIESFWNYILLTIHGNGEAWRFVFAVFLIAAMITVPVYIIVALVILNPIFRFFPKIKLSPPYIYLLIGLGISLLVILICWIVQIKYDWLFVNDFSFLMLVALTDGPLAMLIIWRISIRKSRTSDIA